MEESFASSDFIGKQIKSKQTKFHGYPALESSYSDTRGNVFMLRFVIRGPHYYTILAHGKSESDKMREFLNSFEFTDINYAQAKERVDTSLFFTVKSPVFPEEKEQLDFPQEEYSSDDDEESLSEMIKSGLFRSRMISNDTTGERIFVAVFSLRRYFHTPDSNWVEKLLEPGAMEDSSRITRSLKSTTLPNNFRMWDRVVSDTGSSRAQWLRTYYRDGVGYRLVTEVDTLSKPSSFVQSFFDSFTPADTLYGTSPFDKKSARFFEDFMSDDSVKHKRAVNSIYEIKLADEDLDLVKKAIASLNWKEKKYLDVKKSMIGRLFTLKDRRASDYLKDLYYAAGDTVEVQYACLETLLNQKTPYSFQVFKDVVTNEPPVLGIRTSNNYDYNYNSSGNYPSAYGYSNGMFIDELFDSLPLTRNILPEILPLINLDDYEQPLMRLIGQMVDSNLIKPSDYQVYYSKFLIEAKQEMKKQRISEKNRDINKAELEKEVNVNPYSVEKKDPGNDDLILYATLLLPFEKTNAAVEPLIKQMLASTDDELRYQTMLLMLRKMKPVPDSIILNFARDEEYRYQLYSDLKEIKLLSKFPGTYYNQLDLAKGMLIDAKVYDKADSIVFLKKLPANVKGTKGFVYFFKYKNKKDDLGWKIASAGLMPSDTSKMHFEPKPKKESELYRYAYQQREIDEMDFTEYSDEKISEESPLDEQLAKILKKMVYSKHKSAKIFYRENNNNGRYSYNDEIDF
jgi:hypothetical protein